MISLAWSIVGAKHHDALTKSVSELSKGSIEIEKLQVGGKILLTPGRSVYDNRIGVVSDAFLRLANCSKAFLAHSLRPEHFK